jgi:hypothetical protein
MERIMRTIWLLLPLWLVGACADDATPIPAPVLTPGPIRFDQLAVGQRSQYAVLVGREYASTSESPFEYVSGTLVAEIIDSDATGFRVRESFASPDDVAAAVRDQLDAAGVYEYYLRVERDTLHVAPAEAELRSRLFPMAIDPELRLGVSGPEVEIFGWKTTAPYAERRMEAAIVDGELLGAAYPRLDVTIDNVHLQADGPGATWVYSAQHGLVRSSCYAWWTRAGTGFDLMPE